MPSSNPASSSCRIDAPQLHQAIAKTRAALRGFQDAEQKLLCQVNELKILAHQNKAFRRSVHGETDKLVADARRRGGLSPEQRDFFVTLQVEIDTTQAFDSRIDHTLAEAEAELRDTRAVRKRAQKTLAALEALMRTIA